LLVLFLVSFLVSFLLVSFLLVLTRHAVLWDHQPTVCRDRWSNLQDGGGAD